MCAAKQLSGYTCTKILLYGLASVISERKRRENLSANETYENREEKKNAQIHCTLRQ